MRMSQFFIPTLKEMPADAELMSHRLMLRAGMIRKLASGIYTWLPLGYRVLRKVEAIVREEMNAVGGLEVMMPAIQPAELWHETGRWERYGNELLKITDRHEREFCYGPTHEEVITDLARREIRSYKQLPITFYQIQTKFRDEIRPRFGVMRAREFLMKDAYSFHADAESLEVTYQAMRGAYSTIFTRLGLKFRVVLADNGSIGGKRSEEFQILADAGEDEVVYSEQSDYAANIEKATALFVENRPAPSQELEKFATPGLTTIQALADDMDIAATQSVKTLLVKGEEHPLVALILRGDHELNAIKAEHHPLVASPLQFADEKAIVETIGCPPGSIGPVGLTVPVVIDRDASNLADFVCGANEEGFHLRGVNWERDVPLSDIADLRNVVMGDPSPDGQGQLAIARGIEVGHIFQLGDQYARDLHAMVVEESGQAKPLSSGCYGIGVSRIVAAAIEQNHDDKGIVWPQAIAPFSVVLVPLKMHRSVQVQQEAEKLFAELQAVGIDVLIDDRKERPGVMFSEADLIGVPHRIVISDKTLDQGGVEYKSRQDEETTIWPLDAVVAKLSALLHVS